MDKHSPGISRVLAGSPAGIDLTTVQPLTDPRETMT
jgi:hypothetical protein